MGDSYDTARDLGSCPGTRSCRVVRRAPETTTRTAEQGGFGAIRKFLTWGFVITESGIRYLLITLLTCEPVRARVAVVLIVASPFVGVAVAGTVMHYWPWILDDAGVAVSDPAPEETSTGTVSAQTGDPPPPEDPAAQQAHRDDLASEVAELEARILWLRKVEDELQAAAQTHRHEELTQQQAAAQERQEALARAQAAAQARLREEMDRAEARHMAWLDAVLAYEAAEVDVVQEATKTELLETALQTQDGAAAMEALQQAEDRVKRLRVHPNVFAQSAEQLFDLVLHFEQSWPWVRQAWDATDVQFYDPRLPHGCGGWACAVTGGPAERTPQVWFTLDVLRSAPHRVEDVLLHELGHIWENLRRQGLTGSAWEDARSAFHSHYTGCRRDGMPDERFRGELLADTMVMVTRGITYHQSGWHQDEYLLRGGYYDPQHNGYGENFSYFDANGFQGCLVDGSGPPQHLRDTIRAALR